MPRSDFLPVVKSWFAEQLGEPTAPQVEGWARIRAGNNVLIAAPTGSGKTLAAFLSALDGLLRQGQHLPDETQVLYVSPLRALSNDIHKNLQGPLEAMRALDPQLPEIRVSVRTGDTPQSERARMRKKPPHILVTTPESLYLLLTSAGGREMLRTVHTAIVDEIHATLGDKRGSHLALTLERLSALAGDVQRIGLSATQKPLCDAAHFLVGVDRQCELVDAGYLRELEVELEVPSSPLTAICSDEVWGEIYLRFSELIRQHRTTLVFVNTRKMAERVSARLTETLGENEVDCHHSSLSKARRFEVEQKLKRGELRALVATASLELGIDIGEIDLVIQVGSTRSIATFLQRVGRAGHSVHRIPRGILFPLTRDELVESVALLWAIRHRELDRTPAPGAPLDILAQQIVASAAAEEWEEDELFRRFRRAWPYRHLTAEEFDSVLELHAHGRRSLIHRDGVHRRVLGTRRSRLTSLLNGGAIPDNADYRVLEDPDGTFLGTVDEDFAIESSIGDVFQLGNASWRVLKVERGVMRVADAHGAPPSLPFWFGEAPARSRELSARISMLREASPDASWLQEQVGISHAAGRQVEEYFQAAREVLGTLPSQHCIVLERFFDESGGMQLVVHSPFGGRINRAFGYALRKRFCRGFGFELQAASNEEAILLSLGPQHSFPLAEVFDYLSPKTVRDVLIQAILPTPLFKTRWRWNLTRSLVLERRNGGKKVPPPLLRMRADDYLVKTFPQVMACGETLPPGDLPVPMEHPLVRQTIEDCLTEAMDVDGLIELLAKLRDGRIRKVAVDTASPSVLCQGILAAMPYSFLDDAPLEERRTQAVMTRQALDSKTLDEIGDLDPEAVQRVREEAWPDPQNAEEVHEMLLWMGYLTATEAAQWQSWVDELHAAGRLRREDGRWFAAEVNNSDPLLLLEGRMEALGPVESDDPGLPQLEANGVVLRARLGGKEVWCHRRLLARIRRYTLERLRREIQPVSATDFLRFLAVWQHVATETELVGPQGVVQVIRQLGGFPVPAAAWERYVLPARVKDYRRNWLDELTLTGQVVWGRLWGTGAAAPRSTPICLLLREDLDAWQGLAGMPEKRRLASGAAAVLELLQQRGAMFPQEMQRRAGLLPVQLEAALGELIAAGLLTSDSFGALRQLLVPQVRRKQRLVGIGRWSLFRQEPCESPNVEFIARQLLQRTGVVFRKTVEKEMQPVPWRDLLRVYRRMELRGEVHGGRFVAGFSGEQYALPEAVKELRRLRRKGDSDPVRVMAADPLNYRGILTPDRRVSPLFHREVVLGESAATG